MTKFLESLQKRLAEVDLNSVTKPNDVPIEPNEHAVGEMNDDLKRLLVVRLILREVCREGIFSSMTIA